jgi:hypothetical protein
LDQGIKKIVLFHLLFLYEFIDSSQELFLSILDNTRYQLMMGISLELLQGTHCSLRQCAVFTLSRDAERPNF